MLLSVHEIQPSDLSQLFCSDPRVADEVEAVNRSLHRLDDGIPTWAYMEPGVQSAGKEVAA